MATSTLKTIATYHSNIFKASLKIANKGISLVNSFYELSSLKYPGDI